MRLIDSDRLLTDKMKSKYYHLQNGDIAIPIIYIEHAPTVEAVPVTEKAFEMFESDYKNRLKADMVAMLTDIQLEIEELDPSGNEWSDSLDACNDIIQQKIDKLRGEESG